MSPDVAWHRGRESRTAQSLWVATQRSRRTLWAGFYLGASQRVVHSYRGAASGSLAAAPAGKTDAFSQRPVKVLLSSFKTEPEENLSRASKFVLGNQSAILGVRFSFY